MTAWRRQVVLAGRRLRIEGESELARDAVVPALAHLTSDTPCCEAAQRWIVAEADDRDVPASTGIYRLRGGGVAMVQRAPASVESFEPGSDIRLVATPAAFASGDLRAHPGGLALAAWLAGPTTQVLHVAAVAFAGRAALLVGPGGAGKTTVALACVLSGAAFLGDDLCLVEVGEASPSPPRVHSLFATAKLNPDSLRRLGAESWPRLGVTPKGKTVTGLPPALRAATSAPVAALIVLASTGSHSAPASLRPAEAFAALAATGASPASGAMSPTLWFRIATRLARRVPAFRLPIGWDLERLAGRVRRIAEDGAVRRLP